jgi:hypothetical protein
MIYIVYHVVKQHIPGRLDLLHKGVTKEIDNTGVGVRIKVSYGFHNCKGFTSKGCLPQGGQFLFL